MHTILIESSDISFQGLPDRKQKTDGCLICNRHDRHGASGKYICSTCVQVLLRQTPAQMTAGYTKAHKTENNRAIAGLNIWDRGKHDRYGDRQVGFEECTEHGGDTKRVRRSARSN